jgi:hypothetical protein
MLQINNTDLNQSDRTGPPNNDNNDDNGRCIEREGLTVRVLRSASSVAKTSLALWLGLINTFPEKSSFFRHAPLVRLPTILVAPGNLRPKAASEIIWSDGSRLRAVPNDITCTHKMVPCSWHGAARGEHFKVMIR